MSKEKLRIVEVYVNEDTKTKLENWLEKKKKRRLTIVGGEGSDFNARTEDSGRGVREAKWESRGEEAMRKSKDKKIDKEEERLTKFIEEKEYFKRRD